ncbi:DUF4168 domain-containing protein [Thioalkalivibrio versutus]|uniref:DUF4168 domain-containing protein n=1 Tax=Thioalkalivibrio versutus TaxID=106634 RepID=UPI00036AA055|nr:DUF4168 domain-containing protein [Thioalkalivibrio versutus]OOC48273.1 hypothetical protein B0684_10795 [Thioalkalivibrio versutus]
MNMRKTMLAMALTSLFAVGGAASAQYGGAEGGAGGGDMGGAQGGQPPAQEGGAGGGAQGGQPPQGGAQGGAPMQEAPEVDLSEEDIDTFVSAFVAVQEVREDFADRLQSAEDETEAQSMQQEAQDEMVNAVEDSGMSVEEYNEVAMALQNDPELMQEVQERAEAQL